MTTIILNKDNITSQVANIQNLVRSGEYTVTLNIEPEEQTLARYVQAGRHVDPSYGPFTTSESLFTSLDA
jgi:hypothetical protein